jgi:hypothetical protein
MVTGETALAGVVFICSSSQACRFHFFKPGADFDQLPVQRGSAANRMVRKGLDLTEISFGLSFITPDLGNGVGPGRKTCFHRFRKSVRDC